MKYSCAPAHPVTQSARHQFFLLAQKDFSAAPFAHRLEVTRDAFCRGGITLAGAAFGSCSLQRIVVIIITLNSLHDGLLRGQAAARSRFMRQRHRMPRQFQDRQ
jgi:hypothetical protein